MVRNRCIDFHRLRLRRPADAVTDQVASSEDTFSVVAEQEQSKELHRLLEGIPSREAEVIRLRILSEMSFAEVALIVGTSVPTVKSRFRYGLDKLRRVLNVEGETRCTAKKLFVA
jgi:RNA polymerase sigma-70 factor (ECF subfamily)